MEAPPQRPDQMPSEPSVCATYLNPKDNDNRMFQFFCFAFVISSAKQRFCSPVSLVSITNISPCPLPFLSAREVSKRANSPVCILFEKQYTAINCPLSVTDNLSSLLTLQSSSASLVFLDTSNEFKEFSEQNGG